MEMLASQATQGQTLRLQDVSRKVRWSRIVQDRLWGASVLVILETKRKLHRVNFCEDVCSLNASSPGGKRKESLQLHLWNLNSTSNSKVAPHLLSCQISANQRKAETSTNACKQTLKNTCQLPVLMSLLMSYLPINISHRLFRCRYSNSRDVLANSPFFPSLLLDHPEEPARKLRLLGLLLVTRKKLASRWLARFQDRPCNSHGLTVRLTVWAVNSWSHYLGSKSHG